MSDDQAQEDARIAAAWEVAATALIRGGHDDEPSDDVQAAATNYYIRQDLSRFIANALDAGRASLRMEGNTLLLTFLDEDGTPRRIDDAQDVVLTVAEIAEDGEVSFL